VQPARAGGVYQAGQFEGLRQLLSDRWGEGLGLCLTEEITLRQREHLIVANRLSGADFTMAQFHRLCMQRFPQLSQLNYAV
jgi:hypothetical protein